MKPLFRVLANGADITAKITDRLLSLTVTDEAGEKSDTVEIRIDNRDRAVATPPKGAELAVSLGYEGLGVTYQGLYTVDETEVGGPPDYLTIKGKAADMRGEWKAQKTRSWHDVSLGQLARTIAGEHGLTPAIGADLDGIALGHVDQTDESNLHLLTRLARQYGAVAKVAAGNLVLARKGEAKSVSGKALGAVAVSMAEVESWSLTAADRGKYAAVVATHHDQAGNRKVEVRVGEAEGPAYRLRNEYPTEAAARAGADSKLAGLKRGEATLTLNLSVGRPAAAAEAPLSVSGLHPDADGAWTISKVTHTFDAQGLKTMIEADTK